MKISTERPPLADILLSRFAELESGWDGTTTEGIQQHRRKAADDFRRSGFPTVRDEEWKYTNLSHLLQKEWEEIAEPLSADVLINRYLPVGLKAHLLVFYNGQFQEALSQILEEKQDIILCSFQEALKEHKVLLNQHFGRYLPSGTNGMVAINTALAEDGAFLYVPANVTMNYPVHLLFLNGIAENRSLTNIRNLIILQENSQAVIIEQHRTSEQAAENLSNLVSEALIKDGSQLDLYRLQLEEQSSHQINSTQIQQEKGSLCNTYTISLGGNLVRNDLNYTLAGTNCESHLYGIYVTDGEQHVDNHTFVDHAMPNCFSNEFYKGIMKDRSSAVFNGKIMVRKDAQKTNAYQSNKNVLLSDEAKVNTKPQLEIFADDVKCSHGATTGQLDEEALFYLRSRGIGLQDAKAILTYAFAEDVLENIKLEPLKSYLESELSRKLRR